MKERASTFEITDRVDCESHLQLQQIINYNDFGRKYGQI